MKSVSLYNQIHNRDFNTQGISSEWIQWKGTEVCMDIHCICGANDHIDQDFFYSYQCPVCKRKFAVGANIKLIELTEEEKEYFD